MTDYAALVAALYASLDTWRAVANAVDGPRLKPRGSYYHRIARYRIRLPQAATRRRIRAEYHKRCAGDVTAGYKTLERKRRFPMVVDRPLGLAINEWREKHRITWNQWATKADALMRREYGE